MDKRGCLDVTSVRFAKKSAEISPVDGPTLKESVRGVAVAPNRSEIPVVNSDEVCITMQKFHLAVKEGADIKEDGLVGVVVAVVILPKMQMINGAVDNAHTHELIKGTELSNNGKAFMRKEVHIIDFKKYLVVIKYRYSLLSVLIYYLIKMYVFVRSFEIISPSFILGTSLVGIAGQ